MRKLTSLLISKEAKLELRIAVNRLEPAVCGSSEENETVRSTHPMD
jgi:hypothetical protein